MPATTHTTATQLEQHRITLGDDHAFVMRCQDEVYGPLVADVALFVVAGETIAGADPGPAVIADLIIDEVRQTQQDARPLAA